ncbi:MAG: AbrB/MazE/SpoVT family DNA-binding domain-containing protein [Patescibacteria group bacterium]
MLTKIVTVGNSKGIRIPKLLLEESGFKDKVELTAKRGEIKITPPSRKRVVLNEEYMLSLSSLSDWNTDEEDTAWAYLQ